MQRNNPMFGYGGKLEAPGRITKKRSIEQPGMMMKKRSSERVREKNARVAKIMAEINAKADQHVASGHGQLRTMD